MWTPELPLGKVDRALQQLRTESGRSGLSTPQSRVPTALRLWLGRVNQLRILKKETKRKKKKPTLLGRLIRQAWGYFTVQQTCTNLSATTPQKSRAPVCSARNAYTGFFPPTPTPRPPLSLNFPTSVRERFLSPSPWLFKVTSVEQLMRRWKASWSVLGC